MTNPISSQDAECIRKFYEDGMKELGKEIPVRSSGQEIKTVGNAKEEAKKPEEIKKAQPKLVPEKTTSEQIPRKENIFGLKPVGSIQTGGYIVSGSTQKPGVSPSQPSNASNPPSSHSDTNNQIFGCKDEKGQEYFNENMKNIVHREEDALADAFQSLAKGA